MIGWFPYVMCSVYNWIGQSWLNSDRPCTGRLIPGWTLTDFAQADWFLAEHWPTLHRPTDSWFNSDWLCTDRLIPGWTLTVFAQADWFLAELWQSLHRPTDSWLNSDSLCTDRLIPGPPGWLWPICTGRLIPDWTSDRLFTDRLSPDGALTDLAKA